MTTLAEIRAGVDQVLDLTKTLNNIPDEQLHTDEYAIALIHYETALKHFDFRLVMVLIDIAETAAKLDEPLLYMPARGWQCSQCLNTITNVLSPQGHKPGCKWLALQHALAALEKGE